MGLISMFIHLETEVKLSGCNWQQLWKIWGFESNEIKWVLILLQLSCQLNSHDLCVSMCVVVLTVLQTHKAYICIMTAVAPALSTA